MKLHGKLGPEKSIQCELGCSMVELLKRNRMKYHITKECSMTVVSFHSDKCKKYDGLQEIFMS